jgi:di/tricarboxylate transporter
VANGNYKLTLIIILFTVGIASAFINNTPIIISDLSVSFGYDGLSMFELSTLGVPLAIAGIIFLYFAAPKILPDQASPICHLQDSAHRRGRYPAGEGFAQ